MLAVLILSVSISILGSHATINEMVAVGQQTIPQNFIPPNYFNTGNKGTSNSPHIEYQKINEMAAVGQQTIQQNFKPPSLNFNTENKGNPNNPPPIQSLMTPTNNPQNGAGCPNTAILLNILNILTSSLSQDDKTILDPEKFKYVLTVVKNFLEVTPLNPENLVLSDKLKNLDTLVDKINAPIENPSLRELDDSTSKMLHPYNLPAQCNLNCQAIFNNLINFINTAYLQLLRYCLQTGKCNANNGLNVPSYYNEIYQLNPYALIQRNSTMNIFPIHENSPKASITAGADLVNFIKSQEGKGIYDMMSFLKNYRPSGAAYVPPNLFQSPYDVDLQPNNVYYPPNTVPSQTIFSGLKGLSKNAYLKLLKEFYEGNNLDTTSSIYTGKETPLQQINGQIIPINTGIPNTNPNEILKPNPNPLIDILKQYPSQQQNLLNTNIKITQGEINKIPNFVDNTPTANIHQYLRYLQSLNIQPSVPQNIFPQKPKLLQQSSSYVDNQNQILNLPTVGVYNRLLNQNGLGFNQISPFISVYNAKDNNGQNIFTDNTKQGNYGGQLLDINHLLSVANQGKLNNVPFKNGVVELTYALKRPTPVYESQYYIKYRLPYQTFLYNLQNSLMKKPYLRNESNKLYQELLVGSKVIDTSKNLKGLKYEDIVKLTSTNGTLVTAKILDSNDTTVDDILKVVQRLNSKLPVESIINFSKNTTKQTHLETQQGDINGIKTSVVNTLSTNVHPTFSDVQRRIYSNLNYPYTSIGQYPQRFQYNYPYQTNPGLLNIGFLKYGNVLPKTNNLNNPTLYLAHLDRKYPQLGR